MIPSYLATDAAAQADRELSAFSHPRKAIPPHVIEELEYAANLFERADRAICTELTALEAAGVALDGLAVRHARFCLSRLQFDCKMALVLSRERTC